MIKRLFLLLPFVIQHLFALPCFGQSWLATVSEKRHSRFKYDTNYVLTFKDRLHLSILLAGRENVMNLQLKDPDAEGVKYGTNNRLNIGFGIDYKWLSIETSFKIPFLKGDAKKGNTSVINLRGNIVRQKFWIGAHLQVLDGFYLNNPKVYDKDWNTARSGFPIRSDLRQYMAYFTGNYIFNNKKFSYKAYLTQF